MTEPLNLVVPKNHTVTELQYHEALVAQHADAMRDGTRDHKETLAIADKARPVVQGYTSIIAQADRLRGIRRAA